MIGKLRGKVEEKKTDGVVLDVGGVGYVVFCSAYTLASLPSLGGECSLFIETLVQDGAMRLAGFSAEQERTFFGLLTSVQGVGLRLALVLLGFFADITSLYDCIRMGDHKALTSVPGVGKKLALRLTTELAEKLGKVLHLSAVPSVGEGHTDPRQAREDAAEALVMLGFPRENVYQALTKALLETQDGASSQALIRTSLRLLSVS